MSRYPDMRPRTGFRMPQPLTRASTAQESESVLTPNDITPGVIHYKFGGIGVNPAIQAPGMLGSPPICGLSERVSFEEDDLDNPEPHGPYFSLPRNPTSYGTTLKRRTTTKELVKRYESLNSDQDTCSSTLRTPEASVESHVQEGRPKGRSPIRQSFRNLLSAIGKKAKGFGSSHGLSKSPASTSYSSSQLGTSPSTGRFVPHLDIPSPQTAALPNVIMCNTPIATHSGPLLYLCRPVAPSSLPIWTDCNAVLHPSHILITWHSFQQNPSTSMIRLAQCTDVCSVALHDLSADERGLLPTQAGTAELKVFELLFEEREREKFAAYSATDRAGWVSAIWDAILSAKEQTYRNSPVPSIIDAHSEPESPHVSALGGESSPVEGPRTPSVVSSSLSPARSTRSPSPRPSATSHISCARMDASANEANLGNTSQPASLLEPYRLTSSRCSRKETITPSVFTANSPSLSVGFECRTDSSAGSPRQYADVRSSTETSLSAKSPTPSQSSFHRGSTLPALPSPPRSPLSSPKRFSLYDSPVPKSTPTTPTRSFLLASPSPASTFTRSQSPSIMNLTQSSMVKQRLAEIQRASSSSSEASVPRSTRSHQYLPLPQTPVRKDTTGTRSSLRIDTRLALDEVSIIDSYAVSSRAGSPLSVFSQAGRSSPVTSVSSPRGSVKTVDTVKPLGRDDLPSPSQDGDRIRSPGSTYSPTFLSPTSVYQRVPFASIEEIMEGGGESLSTRNGGDLSRTAALPKESRLQNVKRTSLTIREENPPSHPQATAGRRTNITSSPVRIYKPEPRPEQPQPLPDDDIPGPPIFRANHVREPPAPSTPSLSQLHPSPRTERLPPPQLSERSSRPPHPKSSRLEAYSPNVQDPVPATDVPPSPSPKIPARWQEDATCSAVPIERSPRGSHRSPSQKTPLMLALESHRACPPTRGPPRPARLTVPALLSPTPTARVHEVHRPPITPPCSSPTPAPIYMAPPPIMPAPIESTPLVQKELSDHPLAEVQKSSRTSGFFAALRKHRRRSNVANEPPATNQADTFASVPTSNDLRAASQGVSGGAPPQIQVMKEVVVERISIPGPPVIQVDEETRQRMLNVEGNMSHIVQQESWNGKQLVGIRAQVDTVLQELRQLEQKPPQIVKVSTPASNISPPLPSLPPTVDVSQITERLDEMGATLMSNLPDLVEKVERLMTQAAAVQRAKSVVVMKNTASSSKETSGISKLPEQVLGGESEDASSNAVGLKRGGEPQNDGEVNGARPEAEHSSGDGDTEEPTKLELFDHTQLEVKLDALLALCEALRESQNQSSPTRDDSALPVQNLSDEPSVKSATPNKELQEILKLLKNDEEQRAAQTEQQLDSVRYLNELNSWLETFVNHGVSQIDGVLAGVQQLCKELGSAPNPQMLQDAPPGTFVDGAGNIVNQPQDLSSGLLSDMRRLLATSKEREGNTLALEATVNGLLAAVQEDLRCNAEARNTLTTESIVGLIDRQRQDQERLLRNLSEDLSNDIRGERLRFVEAMKEATAINVQIHVEEFKKELTREVLLMTQEVGRLQKERQNLEQQIADLFSFYAKQKQSGEVPVKQEAVSSPQRLSAPPRIQQPKPLPTMRRRPLPTPSPRPPSSMG